MRAKVNIPGHAEIIKFLFFRVLVPDIDKIHLCPQLVLRHSNIDRGMSSVYEDEHDDIDVLPGTAVLSPPVIDHTS
jgi:hypothetical protein